MSLPLENAATHFENLLSPKMGEASSQLRDAQANFLNEESALGRGAGGEGFSARLTEIYKHNLSIRHQSILECIKKAHLDFGAPLADDWEMAMIELGVAAQERQSQALHNEFKHFHESRGFPAMPLLRFNVVYGAHQSALSNGIREYFWTLRNVPMNLPATTPGQATTTIITINGPGGVVQTCPGAVANVQQQWTQSSTATALLSALAALKEVVTNRSIGLSDKERLVADISNIEVELQRPTPNSANLTAWLSGIAALVGVLSDAKPAMDAVQATAGAFGISW